MTISGGRKGVLKDPLLGKAGRNKQVKWSDLYRNDRIIGHNCLSWTTEKTYKNHIYGYKVLGSSQAKSHNLFLWIYNGMLW